MSFLPPRSLSCARPRQAGLPGESISFWREMTPLPNGSDSRFKPCIFRGRACRLISNSCVTMMNVFLPSPWQSGVPIGVPRAQSGSCLNSKSRPLPFVVGEPSWQSPWTCRFSKPLEGQVEIRLKILEMATLSGLSRMCLKSTNWSRSTGKYSRSRIPVTSCLPPKPSDEVSSRRPFEPSCALCKELRDESRRQRDGWGQLSSAGNQAGHKNAAPATIYNCYTPQNGDRSA